MITFRQIAHVRAVIEHKSVTSAAAATNITQSALTRSICSLEETLGLKLFERGKAGMTPTPFCESIDGFLTRALVTVDDIKHEARVYRNAEGGRINAAVGGAIMPTLLSATLPKFTALLPKVSVTIHTTSHEEIIQQLLDRRIDVAFVGADSYRGLPNMRLEPIASVPLAIFVRREHPLTEHQNIDIEAILDYPPIAAQGVRALKPGHPIHRILGDAAIEPHIVCSDYNVLRNIVLSSDAFLVAPAVQFHQERATGELRMLDIDRREFAIELAVIDTEHRSRSPALHTLIELIKEQFAGDVGKNP